MTVGAIRHRLDDRRVLLAAHVEMLLEAQARGERLDEVQLDLLLDEMEFLVGLYRLIRDELLIP